MRFDVVDFIFCRKRSPKEVVAVEPFKFESVPISIDGPSQKVVVEEEPTPLATATAAAPSSTHHTEDEEVKQITNQPLPISLGPLLTTTESSPLPPPPSLKCQEEFQFVEPKTVSD